MIFKAKAVCGCGCHIALELEALSLDALAGNNLYCRFECSHSQNRGVLEFEYIGIKVPSGILLFQEVSEHVTH